MHREAPSPKREGASLWCAAGEKEDGLWAIPGIPRPTRADERRISLIFRRFPGVEPRVLLRSSSPTGARVGNRRYNPLIFIAKHAEELLPGARVGPRGLRRAVREVAPQLVA